MVARVLALFWSSSLITVSPFPYSQVVVLKSTLFVSYWHISDKSEIEKVSVVWYFVAYSRHNL